MTTRRWLYAAGAFLLAIVAVVAINAWRAHRADQRSRAEQRVDTATPIVQAYKDSLDRARDSLRRSSASEARIDTVWMRPLRPLPATPTRQEIETGKVPLDSLFAVLGAATARGDTLQARGDSLSVSCTRLRHDCDEVARRSALLRSAFDSLVAAQRAVIQTPAPRRRWGPGCVGGYGAVASGGTVRTGPGVTCGLAFSF